MASAPVGLRDLMLDVPAEFCCALDGRREADAVRQRSCMVLVGHFL